jgi:tRNA (cytidine56-2'-O)-methyltransferase
MIEILRLNHRVARDKRISTHLALSSRALSVEKVFYSGEKDKSLESSVEKIVERFGGPFTITHTKTPVKLIKEKKKEGFQIVHLTMYGEDIEEYKPKKKVFAIVGGEKVEGEYYQLADKNLSVGNQPHSELGALAIFLYKFSKLKTKFKNRKLEVIPQARGKLLKEISPK